MKCPMCNAPTEVKQTRKQSRGYVRFRLCFNYHMFKTVETVLQEQDGRKKAKNEVPRD